MRGTPQVGLDSKDDKSLVTNEEKKRNSAKEEVVRETWDKKLDFMLSCIGYAVGLGNIWRFPYLCYRNGGGAFLVPYFIFLLICGIPLFFLELSFGQFGALGPVAIWKIAPIFKGVGYTMMIISFIVCIYYNVIIAYSLHFIFSSLTSQLPWAECGNEWNSAFCKSRTMNSSQPPEWSNLTCQTGYGWFGGVGTTVVNASSVSNQSYVTEPGDQQISLNGSCVEYNTSAQEYFSLRVLKITDGIENVGGFQWELVGYLILAWVIVFCCLFKGVKWSGKVVYFTATFPYLVLVTLLIVGVMEDGAIEGIKFYITPNVTRLGDIRVWSDAAVQIFYSLGAAWGVLLSYSSLNKFNNNVYRDALSICSVNCCTSVLAGFVVFSVLGALAHQTGREVADVVDQGAGLAFVAYPAAVANLPCAPVWAFLFFFMLLNLGLDSQFGMIEAVVNGLLDEVKMFRDNRVKFLAGLCFVQFLLALPMVTESGMYWVTLIDWYSSGLPLMIAAVCEIACIAWVYGVDRFLYDIKCMIGHLPRCWQWWKLAWSVITPLCIILLLITYVVFYTPVTYNGMSYPAWAEAIGWMSALLSILAIPTLALYQVATHPRAKGTFMQRVKELMRCDDDWGPKDDVPYKYRRTSGNMKKEEMALIAGGAKELSDGEEQCSSIRKCCFDTTSSGGDTSESSQPPPYSSPV